jgi:hypothetical protein
MIISKKWLHMLWISPVIGMLFPGLSWAGESPYNLVPTSDGRVVVCPFHTQDQSQVLVCNGAVYVILGEEILVPVSPPESIQQEMEPTYQFHHPLTDPFFQGFPGNGIPAGVIGH